MKNFLKILFFGFLFTFLNFPLSAQALKDPTHWTLKVNTLDNKQYEAITTCIIDNPQWHIYAQNPGGDGTLIPPTFSFTLPKGAKLIGKTVESGKKITEDVDGVGTIYYYKNKVVFSQKFESLNGGKVSLNLKYQTCNDETCLPPKSLSLTENFIAPKSIDTTKSIEKNTEPLIDSPVAAATETISDTPTFDKTNEVNTISSDNETKSTENNSSSKSSLGNIYIFFAGLMAGLVSLVTPCVFAMLPMVISLFLKRSKTKKEGVKVALQYSFSIVLIFAVIGLILMLVANKQILNQIATNWIINIIFFVIFLIFAFSFLGAFEISLPSKWSTATDKKSNINSFSGVFFMALTLAIVSFSCTVPFLNGLIRLIAEGERSSSLIGFLGYGIGLGVPFSIFAIFPNWLAYINKQGGWLNALKVSLAFIEIALAFKFLSNADLVMGWRLLDREIFLAIWIVLSFVLGLYLLGFIKFSHDSELPKNNWDLPYLTVTRTLFALSALTFALYLLPGMWGAPLKGMSSILPPSGTFDEFGASSTFNSSSENKENTGKYADKMHIYEPITVKKLNINTLFDYKEALALAKKVHKPIMLDFTGIACINCRKLETAVWSNPEVSKLMKNDFILVSLYTDAQNVNLNKEDQIDGRNGKITTLAELNQEIQQTKYKSYGQPDYFFIDENENLLIPDGYGYSTENANPKKFESHLKKALAKHKELNP